MSVAGFAYSVFGSLGERLTSVFKGLRDDIKGADMRIYPPAYASIVVLSSLISLLISGSLGFLFYHLSAIGRIPIPPRSALLSMLLLMTIVPVVTFFLGMLFPKLRRYGRLSRFDLELPYLSVYISVMATGGVSPYTCFERLARAPKVLFNEVKKEAIRFFLDVRAMGYDPLTAIEESAKRSPHEGYRQLLMGYATTLRTGGDVIHYLQRQTELMLKERVSQVRAVGERMAMLMEAYMASVVLTALTLYVLFVVNYSLAQAGFSMGGGFETQFFLFSYIYMPVISGLFIYVADLMQPKYPLYDSTPIKVYLMASLPLTILLFIGMALPYLLRGTLLGIMLRSKMAFLAKVPELVCRLLSMPKGFESGVGTALSLMIGIVPALIVEVRSTMLYEGIQHGLTRFLRDLVEVRKTGLSPEKCITNLRRRDYGRFSKYLRSIAREVGWGVPLSRIFERFYREVKNWFAVIVMFLLVESIEVGGGTARTLEALASYAETLEQLEKEKRSMMRPLLLIPYIGAIIIIVVVLILIGFMSNIMSMMGAAIGTRAMVNIFLPPVIINTYIMGLTAGKISAEKVSAGFKHALLLTSSSLLAMALTPTLVSKLLLPIKL